MRAEAPAHGMMFSTPDVDSDENPTGSCALERGAAWWYHYCSHSYINGNNPGSWAAGSYVEDVQGSHMLVKTN